MDKHTVGQPSPVIQDEMPGDLYAELAHWTEVLRSVQATQQASQGGSTGAVPIVAPAAPQPPAPTVPGAWPVGALRCPPGWAGVIAQYIYDQAPRPQAEAAIVASLGLLAGICGRQWSISNTGLNIYLVLVARSATGKEAIHSGVGRLCAFVGAKNNDVAQFVSANEYASAQALKKELGTRLGFVNLRGEIGHWFAEISKGKNDVVTGLKRELTNLYMKSSRGTLAGGLAYSNRDKNVEIDTNVAYSLIGDTTPGTFYSSLDARMMEDGFISRFTVVEYTGDRPDENPTPSVEPPEALVAYLAGLVFTATEYLKRDQYALVSRDDDASLILQAFADECDTHIREAGADEFRRQMWNRAHLKALRISALLAVADNYVHPCINREQAEWAIDLIRRDISVFDRRLRSGDIGDESDTNRHEKLLDICRDYITLPPEDVLRYAKCIQSMRVNSIVPREYLQKRTQRLAMFEKPSPPGHKANLDRAIKAAVENGYLKEVDKAKVAEDHNYHGKAYRVLRLDFSRETEESIEARRAAARFWPE
ncbi:DUF3987 domain-containing protein [Pseudomonas aeruginosa]|uniref:DUF3987 domain-containing protein n=1 Tax=Pseudomonas aeruginosa TaxID=287 RepID=UPI00244C123A|nr:DUF3987 domain-containing protein [Pseudomonas aeruginosa]MDH1037966.1 YfjI family protein [Pseudomonas aeruginosa]